MDCVGGHFRGGNHKTDEEAFELEARGYQQKNSFERTNGKERGLARVAERLLLYGKVRKLSGKTRDKRVRRDHKGITGKRISTARKKL